MIVVDDYIEGRIYAGQEKYNLENLRASMWEVIHDDLTDLNTKENPIHIKNEYNDFYVFHIHESELMEYMASRDCTNYITGV